jgi:hypothetical protein
LLTGELVPVRRAAALWVEVDGHGGARGWVDARDLIRPDGRAWRD